MDICPICRASLNGASTCRRCRADLQRVQEIERLGQAMAGAAMLSLARGQNAMARQLLRRARAVHATPAVQALARLMAEPQPQ
jgi:predicted amidophosphoribosyltransferase